MKNLFLVFLFSTFFSSSLFATIIDDYARIFTRDIYVVIKDGNEKCALIFLRVNKRQAVERNLTDKMRQERDALKKTYQTNDGINAWVIVGVQVTCALFPPATAIGVPIALNSAKEVFSTSQEEAQARKLTQDIRDLEGGVLTEPVYELECEYVKRKCLGKMPKKLEEVCENVLLQSRRRGGYPNFDPYKYVRTAIKIPYLTKNPLDGQNGQTFQDKISSFFDSSLKDKGPLCLYEKSLSNEMKSIIASICRQAQVQDSPNSLSNIIIFCGPPGCGKSHLARTIASICRLPFLECGPESEYRTNRCWYGASKYAQEECKGILLEALLSEDDNGECFLNPILIINEIDEILKDPSGMKMLSDVLDPSKKTFKSRYFDCNLDCSKIIVIGTANETPGLDKNFKANNEAARAFWDRTMLVRMEKFSETSLRKLLIDFMRPSP